MDYGLDVGTNMIVAATVDDDGKSLIRMQRDAFYRIVPKSAVNRNGIKMSLEKRGANFIVDGSDFIIVGEDALEMAIERNDVAKRPLKKGVISPKEKHSLPMLKLIIENLVGKGDGKDTLVYSVPARPIDSDFDIVYHKEMLEYYLGQMGYKAMALNEAYAIGLSEILEHGDELTGICISYGAGMTNIAVILQGDNLVEFSVTRAGDFIDESVGKALDVSPSLIQMEKEAGVDLLKPQGKIMEAVAIYYNSVINYTLQNIAYELKRRRKELPMFREAVPIVVSGGLTLANGFEQRVEKIINDIEFPLKVGKVVRAKEPMKAVAQGCFLASQM